MLRRTCRRLLVSDYNLHPPLTQSFGTQVQTNNGAAAKDIGVKVSTLANGSRLITHDAEGPVSAVGVYVEAGAKYDPALAPGLNYVLRYTMLHSNLDNSLFQNMKTIEATGVSSEDTQIRKRFIGTKIEGRRDMWQRSVENLFTGVSIPRFAEQDIGRFRDHFDTVYEETRWINPRAFAIERATNTAFFREPCGNSTFVKPGMNEDCSSKACIDQWAALYQPERVTIAGVNVNHEEVIALYENAPFPHSNKAPHHAKAAQKALDQSTEENQYQGGELFENENRHSTMGTDPHMNNETIVAVGFRAAGRDANLKSYATSLVLSALIDVTNAEGIRRAPLIHERGIQSFYSPFSSAGLVGVTIRATEEEKAIAQTTDFLKNGLNAAKAASLESGIERAVCSFYTNQIDNARDYVDFLGSSLQPAGTKFLSPAEVVTAIQSVKAADIAEAVKYAQGARPTLYATGATKQIPSLRQLGF